MTSSATFIHMAEEIMDRLSKDYSFLLKIAELIIACVCVGLLAHYDRFELPTWLWILYSIDSLTYAIIFFVLALSHILDEKREILAVTYFIFGIFLHFAASISGFIRVSSLDEKDNENWRYELAIGILLIFNALFMAFEIIFKTYSHLMKSN